MSEDGESVLSFRSSDLEGSLLLFSTLTKLTTLFTLLKLIERSIPSVIIAIVAIYAINGFSTMAIKGREEALFKRVHYLIILLIAIASPLNRVLEWFTSHFREEESEVMEKIVEEEELLEQGGSDSNLLKNLLLFNATTVDKIIVPRVDVVALDLSFTKQEVRERALLYGFSRMPVYEGDLDNIKGFLYTKDLINLFKDEESDGDWREFIREAYFVPGNKKISDLLQEFRAKKIHLAVVIDEWGGTKGVVTLEDVVEEIVGEISDESD